MGAGQRCQQRTPDEACQAKRAALPLQGLQRELEDAQQENAKLHADVRELAGLVATLQADAAPAPAGPDAATAEALAELRAQVAALQKQQTAQLQRGARGGGGGGGDVEALAAELKRHKERFAMHEAKVANLSKRSEVDIRGLQDRVWRLSTEVEPCVASVAALQADYGAAHARAVEVATATDAAAAELVRRTHRHSERCACVAARWCGESGSLRAGGAQDAHRDRRQRRRRGAGGGDGAGGARRRGGGGGGGVPRGGGPRAAACQGAGKEARSAREPPVAAGRDGGGGGGCRAGGPCARAGNGGIGPSTAGHLGRRTGAPQRHIFQLATTSG